MLLTKLRRMLDNKEISCIELTKEYLKKIKYRDSEINSYITVCEDIALEQAQKAQKAVDNKNIKALTGIPVGIKDNICTKGIRTTCASKMLSDYVPQYNATVVDKLLDDNAVIIGKNNLDEFAMGSANDTSYFGKTKNPLDLLRVPGGSSGGSAASVCAGLCPVSLGTDTGGSVRQPAAFCGLVGFKPTYGTVSRYGVVAFSSSLDQVGVIANSCTDAALVMNVISGVDKKDNTTHKLCEKSFDKSFGMSVKGLKIGIVKEYLDDVTDDVKKSVYKTADFYKSMGAQIVEVPNKSYKISADVYKIISSVEVSSNLSRFDGVRFGYRENRDTFEELIRATRTDAFGKEVKKRIAFGNFILSGENYEKYYVNALKLRQQIINEYNDMFNVCDVLLVPTAPSGAYKISENDPEILNKYLADKCTLSANIVGLPAVSIPCGKDLSGMPIGISLMGKRYEDAKILAIADLFDMEYRGKSDGI